MDASPFRNSVCIWSIHFQLLMLDTLYYNMGMGAWDFLLNQKHVTAFFLCGRSDEMMSDVLN